MHGGSADDFRNFRNYESADTPEEKAKLEFRSKVTYETLDKWFKFWKEADKVALAEIIDNDVVFYSPVVDPPQNDKEIAIMNLEADLACFVSKENFVFTTETIHGSRAFIEF